MKPLSRRLILPLFLLCALASNATPKDAAPYFNVKIFLKSVEETRAEENTSKICACQLLDVKSTNEDFRNLALFAEKTNGGLMNERQATVEVLNKERKKLKTFYSNITVTRQIVVAMDCASLIKKLKGAYENLKIFETLDADVRLAIKK